MSPNPLIPLDLDAILTWLLRLEDRSLTAAVTSLGDGAGLTRLGITSKWDSTLVPHSFFTEPAAQAIIDAKSFYTTQFWDKLAIPTLCSNDPTLCAALLSCAVNIGPETALGLLKSANSNTSTGSTVDKFTYLWCEHYYDLVEHNPNDQRFLGGWLSRAKSLYPNLPQ